MDGIEERRERLRTAIAEEWGHELRESPEFATAIGDYRYLLIPFAQVAVSKAYVAGSV